MIDSIVKYSVGRTLPELDDWVRQRREDALEPDLPIIDPHMHAMEDERGRYLIDETLLDISSGHNLVATVFVQSEANMYRADGPLPMQPVGEVEFANGIAAMSASGRYGKSRLCAGIVGHADLTLGGDVRPVLEAMIAAGNERFRGIRHGLTWDASGAAKQKWPRHLALAPAFQQGFAVLESLGLSFDAWLFHPQLADVAALLREFPEANVILNHSGGLIGGIRDPAVFPVWRDQLRQLVQYPNLCVKAGGLGMPRCGGDFHQRAVPPSSVELADAWRPYVETCIELFGPARCMLESNFPVDKQSCGYGVLWNAFKRITRDYSASEKAWLYHGTAAKAYLLSVNVVQ
jgi:predicted TIM-barrel fold metal-dependent hydrolase